MWFVPSSLAVAVSALLPHEVLQYVLPTLLAFFLGVLVHKFLLNTHSDGAIERRLKRKYVLHLTQETPHLSLRVFHRSYESKRRKQLYPKTYPNGWFKLANSSDFKVGETKRILW